MSESSFLIIKIILGVVGGIFGILAAFFVFLDTAQQDRHEKTQAWFRAKWISVHNSPWLTLPERIIQWLLHFKTIASQSWSSYSFRLLNRPSTAALITITVFFLFALGCLFHWRLYGTGLSGYLILCLLALCGISRYIARRLIKTFGMKRDNRRRARIDFRKLGETIDIRYPYLSLLFPAAFYGTTALLWILIMLKIDICLSAVIMTAMSPLYWVMIGLSLYPFLRTLKLDENHNFDDVFFLFNIGISTSFAITFIALLVGHIAGPQAWVPQTFQVLVSNSILDGMTMVATFSILSWAVVRPGFLRIPFALLVDIFVAAILACCSLFFGLVFTDKALSLHEILHVLIARSPDGFRYEIGPYFWVMHTTFLPSLLYLALIFFTWLGRAILVPIKWFFGKGQEHKNPLRLTAALCFLIATIFGFLAFATESVEKHFGKQKRIETVSFVDRPFGYG